MDRPRQVDYAKTTTPESYICANCGVRDVKLWKQLFRTSELLCAVCASEALGIPLVNIKPDGGNFYTNSGIIGNGTSVTYYPAIPLNVKGGVSYWTNKPIPEEGRIWWKQLPTLSKERWEQVLTQAFDEAGLGESELSLDPNCRSNEELMEMTKNNPRLLSFLFMLLKTTMVPNSYQRRLVISSLMYWTLRNELDEQAQKW